MATQPTFDIDAIDQRTPILVGAAVTDQRADDPANAAEPIALMIAATEAAGRDSGSAEILRAIEHIAVPVGRWQYGDAGAMIGRAVGASNPHTVAALPGVSQQTIMSTAAARIAAGEIETALVVGGEGGHRMLQARIAGIDLVDTPDDGVADSVLQPDDGILPRYEMESGLGYMPVGYYALIDSAWRHAHGLTLDDHRARMANRYAGFSATAAANPDGWDDTALDAATINNARMLAFPYAKHHVSNWNIDQASALIFTSVGAARRFGIDPSRWIFPQAFTEANHQVAVSARDELGRCVGAEKASAAALDAAGCTADDLDLIELYTCFPVAVDTFLPGLGIEIEIDDPRSFSFCGAMPFAGGPFNNYVLHSTAQLAPKLRATRGSRGLVSTVSGLLTKQGVAIWGTDPNPDGFQFVDVTAATAADAPIRDVDPDHQGAAVIAASTVVHTKAGPERGVIVVDLADGRRSVASTDDPALMARMEAENMCGLTVEIDQRQFTLP